MTIKSLFHKITYTPLHEKQNLVDTYLTFLDYILNPNAIDCDESYTQGPDTVFVPLSYFDDSSDGQNRESCPTSDPSVLQLSKSKSNGETQDIETTTDLAQNDSSKQTSEPRTDIETTCEPMPQPPLRRSHNTSTAEINNPTTENIPQIEPSHSRGGKDNLRPNPNPHYSEIYRYRCVQQFIRAPFRVLFSFSIFFRTHIIQLLLAFLYFLGQIHTKTNQQQLNNRTKQSL